jgi:prepilin-type N-terminal cleavage/methylation domain-containing protein
MYRTAPMTDRNKRGFTLLELAIVITIIATMTGMGIMAGVNALENARISQTNNKIAQIERAIWAYRVSNDRLPCPASLTLPLTSANFGVEGPNSANCINATAGAATGNFTSTDGFVVEGQVPTKTLGVPDDFAFDGWGNRLRYSVNLQLVETNGFSSTPADDTCAGSKITDGTSPTNFRTQSAAYALVSHGPNGHGAYTRSGAVKNAGSTNTGELSNCSCNSTAAATTYTATYVQRAEFRNPASSTDQFDDIVDYQMIWQMQRPVQNVVTTSTDTTNILGVVSLPNATPSAISSILLKQESGVFSFLPIANVSPMFGGTGWSQRAWTRDKSYVAYVHNSTIQLYKRVGDRLTRVSSFVSPTPGIPGYFQVQWSWSGKYLATASVGAGADGLYIFKRCGSKITQLNTTATHPIGTWQWTRDDQYLVNDWFSWFGVVKRTGDTFATAPTSELYPSGRPGGTQAPPIVSPSGDYAIHIEGNTIFPYVRNASGQYIPSSVPSVTVKAALGSWSPDETYFIMSHPWSDGTPDYLKAIKRNGSGVTATFTKLPASALVTQPDCGGSAWDIGWSADSQYFAVSGYGYGCNGIQTYRNNRDDTFTWLGTVAPPPGYGVYYGHTSEFGTFGKY